MLRSKKTPVAIAVKNIRTELKVLCAVLSAASLLVMATASHAQARAVTYDLDIPSQDLNDALQSLAMTLRRKMLYSSELVSGKSSEALKGQFTAEQAFSTLLTGTDLIYELTSDGYVLIRKAGGNAVSESSDDWTGTLRDALSRVEDQGALRVSQSGTAEESDRAPTNASAEPTSSQQDSASGIQEIVVTAQKREERLQDVPISITVLGGTKLDSARGNGLLDALASTPSVAISESIQGGTSLLGVRGVNATAAFFNGASPIGFYFDALPFGLVRSAPIPNLTPYDLDRVEVLRGPQGTLYGASSLNGVVRVITKNPDLESVSAKALASLASTTGGSESYRGDLAINVPIIPGKFAARVVAGREDRGGWIDTPNRENVNDTEVTNLRLKLKAEATDSLSFTLSGWRSRTDLGGLNVSDSNGRRGTDDQENVRSKFDTASFLIDFRQPRYTLSSATSYLDYSASDDLSLDELGLPPDFPLFDYNLTGEIFAQEFLVNSNAQGPWRWSGGLFYRKADESLFQEFAQNDLTYESESVAYFGQLTRLLFGDRLELTAGLRYFEDRVKYRDNPGSINVSPPFVTSSDQFNKITPKATVSWHLSSDVALYASYAEGFRSGFSQFSTVTKTLAPDFPPAGPDELASYEIGTKGNVAGGRISFEGAVYYLDWKDTQQTVSFRDTSTGASFPAALNTGAIDGFGVDVMVSAQLLRGLDLTIDFGWNDLAFSEPVFSDGQILFDKGYRPPLSAEKTFGTTVTYRSPAFGNGWVGRAEASIDYTSEIGVTSVINGIPSTVAGDSLLLARSSIALEAPKDWTITAYVDNVNNSRAMQTRGFLTWNTLVWPRTYGLQLEYRFQ